MLAKIIAAAAASVLLTGNALASGSTVSGLHNLVNSNQVYTSHSNSRGHRYAATPAPNGYKDTQGSRALGGGPG